VPDLPALDFQPLTTERLTLRRLRASDAADLHRLVNDWAVVRMLSALPFPYPRPLADEWIASTSRGWEQGREYHFAITGFEAGQEMLIGAAGLKFDAGKRSAALGYWVGRRFWGHGVATEATRKLVSWALANLDLDRITACVIEDNEPSARVLLRNGFKQIGTGKGAFRARGGEHPVREFAITRDDIPAAREEAADTPETARPLLLVAACALIDPDGRVLLTRRPEGKKMAGLWEFPGGKLDPFETPEQALIRELQEELGIDVAVSCLAPFAFASHAYERFHLLMPLFLCRRWKNIPVAREGQTLAWVRPAKLHEYKMPPADLPLVPLLRDFL